MHHKLSSVSHIQQSYNKKNEVNILECKLLQMDRFVDLDVKHKTITTKTVSMLITLCITFNTISMVKTVVKTMSA